MIRSTVAIKLLLVGTATSLLGYEAFRPAPSPFNNPGGDFADDLPGGSDFGPTSQPGNYSSYNGSYYHSHYGWFHSYSGGGWSSSSSRSGSSSASHSGTSRGGFGHSGHASGS